MNKEKNDEQINTIISLHEGDIVKNAIMHQKHNLYKVKKKMLEDLITIEENGAEWMTRSEALNEYITNYPESLESWISEMITIAYDNDIYIDDILVKTVGNDEKKMFDLETRLRYILKECILKL